MSGEAISNARREMMLGAAASVTLLAVMPARATEAAWGAGMVNGGRPFPEPMASQLIEVFNALPYIEEGRGTDILYVHTHNRCPICLRMTREYPGPIPGFRTRYYLASLVGQSQHALLRLLRTRTPEAFRLYMARQLSEAPFSLSTADAALLNRTNALCRRMRELTTTVDARTSFGTPFLHRVRGRSIIACAGYGPDTIDKMRS